MAPKKAKEAKEAKDAKEEQQEENQAEKDKNEVGADGTDVAADSKPSAAVEGNNGKQDEKSQGYHDDLDRVVQMMHKQEFGKASVALEKMLSKEAEDPVLLHNLGVVYTEQERYAEAEEVFMQAFEAQKKIGKFNYATLFGLGTVLTEQGGTGKLLQAEALFRDCLMKAIAEEERGVSETYRTFSSLAENLGMQKRWKDAAEAYEQAYELGSRMFGPDHERTVAQQAMVVRAKKLANMQKYMRGALWACTAAVPVLCAWLWKYSGAPSLSEIFMFSTGQSDHTGMGHAAPLG